MKEYLARQEEKELARDGYVSKPSNPFTDKPSPGGGAEGSTGSLGLAGAQDGSKGPATGQHILVMLLRLRQCCSHLSLMKDVSRHSVQ